MTLTMELGAKSYDIIVERGALSRCGEYLDLNRRALIVADSQVPPQYAEAVAKACLKPVIVTVPTGESSKSLAVFEQLCRRMLDEHFTRSDCVVAVGGGVCGDLAGFVAASFMRGVDFYNIPTTLLSQVDSSIGGKVAVNLDSVKNILGAFYQPRRVLIDPETLNTLPQRQIASGLAEAIKMACTFDAQAFARMEQQTDLLQDLDYIIEASLRMKKAVVEQDETEQGLRKLLNFGHTIGHGIESCGGLYHGECVALGMLPMCDEAVRRRLLPLLEKAALPTRVQRDLQQVWQAMLHDKKFSGDSVTIAYVPEIGKGELRKLSPQALQDMMKGAFPQ